MLFKSTPNARPDPYARMPRGAEVLPHLGVSIFFRGGGKISIIGVARTPVAIFNYAFFVQELLVESHINSENFTEI